MKTEGTVGPRCRAATARAVLLAAGLLPALVHGNGPAPVYCKADPVAVASLHPALRAEKPLRGYADQVVLSTRPEAIEPAWRRDLALTLASADAVRDVRLTLDLSAPGLSAKALAPALGPALTRGTLDESQLANVERLIGQDGIWRTQSPLLRIDYNKRVIGGEDTIPPARMLPRPVGQKPDPVTAPWTRVSADERARISANACTTQLVDAVRTAERALVSALGYSAGEAPTRMDELLRLAADTSAADTRRIAAARYVDAYRAMLQSCTRPVEQTALLSGSGLREDLGVLRIGSSRECTVLLVGRRHVLTARHCLFDPATGKFRLGGSDLSDIWVELEQPDARYQVCAEVAPRAATPFTTTDDYLLLRIADTGRPGARVRMASEAELRDGLDAPTELTSVSRFSGSTELGLGSPLGLREFAGRSCLVYRKQTGCYYHACATQPGGSGAPLFFRTPDAAGTILLAGVHIGEAPSAQAGPDDVNGKRSCAASALGKLNVASRPPALLLEPFNQP